MSRYVTLKKWNIRVTEWLPYDLGYGGVTLKVCHVFGTVWLESRGGRILKANLVEHGVLTPMHDSLEVRKLTVRNLVRAWERRVEELAGQRIGVLGYRGYFQIMKVHAMSR
jgi:hypothetical protein